MAQTRENVVQQCSKQKKTHERIVARTPCHPARVLIRGPSVTLIVCPVCAEGHQDMAVIGILFARAAANVGTYQQTAGAAVASAARFLRPVQRWRGREPRLVTVLGVKRFIHVPAQQKKKGV